MKIPVDSIPKVDAIQAALNFIEQVELRDRENMFAHGPLEVPFTRGEFERIAKVLLVGIGELSK